ncbi:MAG TPA: hypothetical protein VKR60_15875 [Candidatus Sulfotelmatobacter sp.]|nr:hypothetical protein [Candidatus Sulfotelmatobacter sp.]
MRRLRLGLIGRLAVVCGLCGSLGAFGQSAPVSCTTSPPTTGDQNASVAAAARTTKKPAARAKKVIDDDDLALHQGPIPRLNLDGVDNTAEIVAAIKKYKEIHTPQQTEQALHDWFDETNDVLTAALRETNALRDIRESNTNNSNDLCQDSGDWEQCQKLRMADARGARRDQNSIRNDGFVTGRIQQALQKIRSDLFLVGMRYEWFKIQNANGFGSF